MYQPSIQTYVPVEERENNNQYVGTLCLICSILYMTLLESMKAMYAAFFGEGAIRFSVDILSSSWRRLCRSALFDSMSRCDVTYAPVSSALFLLTRRIIALLKCQYALLTSYHSLTAIVAHVVMKQAKWWQRRWRTTLQASMAPPIS